MKLLRSFFLTMFFSLFMIFTACDFSSPASSNLDNKTTTSTNKVNGSDTTTTNSSNTTPDDTDNNSTLKDPRFNYKTFLLALLKENITASMAEISKDGVFLISEEPHKYLSTISSAKVKESLEHFFKTYDFSGVNLETYIDKLKVRKITVQTEPFLSTDVEVYGPAPDYIGKPEKSENFYLTEGTDGYATGGELFAALRKTSGNEWEIKGLKNGAFDIVEEEGSDTVSTCEEKPELFYEKYIESFFGEDTATAKTFFSTEGVYILSESQTSVVSTTPYEDITDRLNELFDKYVFDSLELEDLLQTPEGDPTEWEVYEGKKEFPFLKENHDFEKEHLYFKDSDVLVTAETPSNIGEDEDLFYLIGPGPDKYFLEEVPGYHIDGTAFAILRCNEKGEWKIKAQIANIGL